MPPMILGHRLTSSRLSGIQTLIEKFIVMTKNTDSFKD